MRRIILLLAALFAVSATAALAHGGGPKIINLPDGFAPEGIETKGKTAWVGSVATGAVREVDLRKGTTRELVPGAAGQRAATGIEYDRGRLWVAGAGFGNVIVYSARTGAPLHTIPLAAAPTFINDLVTTKRAVWLTDSQKPVLYKVPLTRNGEPGAPVTVPLTGDYTHVPGFNLNGIVATRNGKALIAVQSAAQKLYRIDPETGAAKLIDLGGYALTNGDGLLLHGRKLYVVQNRDDKVAVFRLSRDLTKATFLRALTETDGSLSVPTTIDRSGGRLYVVNARFQRTTPTDQRYWITRLSDK
jgi:sugar lactone lactonase YvrE